VNWFIGITMYVVIWWLVIFAILPFGVSSAEEGDPGHAAGAPRQPHLARKAVATTIVAALVWLLIYWVVASDLVNLRGS
jgi:predicted secreted protein